MNGLHAACSARVMTEPESKFTLNGKPFMSFSAIVDVGHTSSTEERPAPEPTWLRVSLWEPRDELVAALKKGSPVYLEGSLRLNQWTAADGTPRSGLNLSCWRCDVHAQLGRKDARDVW